jgi:hypothetical protein
MTCIGTNRIRADLPGGEDALLNVEYVTTTRNGHSVALSCSFLVGLEVALLVFPAAAAPTRCIPAEPFRVHCDSTAIVIATRVRVKRPAYRPTAGERLSGLRKLRPSHFDVTPFHRPNFRIADASRQDLHSVASHLSTLAVTQSKRSKRRDTIVDDTAPPAGADKR